jgi:hypothetical protein
MKLFHQPNSFWLFLLLVGLPAVSWAIPDFCGNKHKNLILLKEIIKDIPHTAVPDFIGIPSTRIEAFLRQHVPEIFIAYSHLLTALPSILSGDAAQGERMVYEIQEKIKAAFINFDFIFTPREQALFGSIAAQGQFFMVRSTGMEDGAIANAGAHASIAYVAPRIPAIKQAIGEVIASYFNISSLKNRLSSGENLLSGNLCLPVLIQVLIGEPFDGAGDVRSIPISGVAYTTNQSLSSSSLAITEINAAYGHGEGVVANRVTADRYYITPSRSPADVSIYPMLYYKQERLVPHYDAQLKINTLVTHNNTPDLASSSALSLDQVKQLYTVLKKIEQAYAQPMDVEFVVLDATLYIVQARPAMHVAMHPSYITFDQLAPEDITQIISGDIIVPGKAETLIITDPRDVIIAKTLDEADQMSNSTQCAVVMANTWASSLSHAAVNFKTYGTPCMVIYNMGLAKQLIAQISPTTPLIIDVQQRCIALWKSTSKKPQDYIQYGWLVPVLFNFEGLRVPTAFV